MQLKTIRELLHAQLLHLRNCDNLVQSDNFQIAFSLASEEEQSEVLLAIAEASKDKLKQFISEKIKEADRWEQLGITQLQEIARHIRLPYYKQYSKLELISRIKENVAERIEKSCE